MSDEFKIKTAIGQNSHFRDKDQNEPHVDLEDEKCLIKWASVLGITVAELKMAVKEFGPKIKKIRLGLAAQEREKERRAA